ncbi:MAG: MinD/ParA family protein [Clostridia bacterium]|jgi:flagellar biosynthesis protein FlhG|nr:MinD/ParA family protein [Clostridia bacterium]
MKDQALKLRLMSKNIRQKIEDSIEGKRRKTKVIAVTSGKGGVGKTNFTINFGLALIQYGHSVMILDADLGMANVDLVLGINPDANLYHVLAGNRRLSDIIIEGPQGLQIIPGGSGIAELADLEKEQVWHFISQLEQLEGKVDILLIDTGAGISRNVLSFLLAADEVILLTSPEPPAIADAYGVIKAMVKQQLVKTKKIYLVVNKVENESEGQIAARKLEMAANKFLNYQLLTLGYLPVDGRVVQSVKDQKPFILSYPNAKVSYALNTLTARFCELPVKVNNSNGMISFMQKAAELFKNIK